MAKTFTKDDVSAAADAAAGKGELKGAKTARKDAVQQVNNEIERVKASDLGKAEKKAAINALKIAAKNIKAPV